MSGHFVRSSVNGETIPVSWLIENFSLHVSGGYYEGPEFQGGQSDSKWKFVVYASEGDHYRDFLDIQLRRESFKGKDQFVKVKLSVIDRFGSGWVSREVQLCYSGSSETRQVLSVSRCDPLNKVLTDVPFAAALYRLNKKRLLPNDTLTIKGEIVIYEENQTYFRTAEEFESNMERTRSDRLTSACLVAREWIFTLKDFAILFLGLIFCSAKAVFNFVSWSFVVPLVVNILRPIVVRAIQRLLETEGKCRILGPLFLVFSAKKWPPFELKCLWKKKFCPLCLHCMVLLSTTLFSWLKYEIVECLQNEERCQRMGKRTQLYSSNRNYYKPRNRYLHYCNS